MATNDAPERREKVVMALGLVAIILFSANLMAMVARHFWPNMPIIGEPRTEQLVFESIHHVPHVTWEIQTDDLERDLRRLEYRIFRENAALNASTSGHIRLNDTHNRFEIRLQNADEAAVASIIAPRIATRIAARADAPRVVVGNKRVN